MSLSYRIREETRKTGGRKEGQNKGEEAGKNNIQFILPFFWQLVYSSLFLDRSFLHCRPPCPDVVCLSVTVLACADVIQMCSYSGL